LGKTIFPQQLQPKPRIFAVGLLFAHPLRRDLGGIADPQLHLQLRQQPLEPARVPAGFDPHPHLYSAPLQLAIKPFGLACAVLQPQFATLSVLLVEPRNLLHARVIITSLYLDCNCPILRSRATWGSDRVSAGGRSSP
jgi:hypothetical protein